MILLGPRLLVNSKRAWSAVLAASPRKATWLVAAALTAAVWPGVSVVAGHVGSAALGLEETSIAALRAAVGFISVVGGAVVTAPALSLILVWISALAHEKISAKQAGAAAMCIVWPTWTSGVILAIVPLFGFGPELGEIVWLVFVLFVAQRAVRQGAVPALAIRRRWKARFVAHATASFILVFMIVTIAPAMAVRSMLGAATTIIDLMPNRPSLPTPPQPNW